MKNNARTQKWLAPRPIRWWTWMALLSLALVLNMKYASVLISYLPFSLQEDWQVWLASILPAVTLVLLLLMIRWVWYEVWRIYQHMNHYVYEAHELVNQQYWADSILLSELIFRCGQLNGEDDLMAYYLADDDTRRQSSFNLISQEIPLYKQTALGTPRVNSVLAWFVEDLKNRQCLTSEFVNDLWVWMGDESSWLKFREAVMDAAAYCPQTPDRYAVLNDWNWIVDRYTEGSYDRIMVLGFECQAGLELYLGMIFDEEGKKAKYYRNFALADWAALKDYFMLAATEKTAGFQLPKDTVALTPVLESLDSSPFEIEDYDERQPEFVAKLTFTRPWLKLLLMTYQLQLHSYSTIMHDSGNLIPLSSVNVKRSSRKRKI